MGINIPLTHSEACDLEALVQEGEEIRLYMDESVPPEARVICGACVKALCEVSGISADIMFKELDKDPIASA